MTKIYGGREASAWRRRAAKKKQSKPAPPAPAIPAQPAPRKARPLFAQPAHVDAQGNLEICLPDTPTGLPVSVTLRFANGMRHTFAPVVAEVFTESAAHTPVERLLVAIEHRFRPRVAKALDQDGITTVQGFFLLLQEYRTTEHCVSSYAALLLWAGDSACHLSKGIVNDHLIPALVSIGHPLPP